jgi:hypothetical protein
MSIFLDLYIFNPFHIYIFSISTLQSFTQRSTESRPGHTYESTWLGFLWSVQIATMYYVRPQVNYEFLSGSLCTSCQSQSCLHSSFLRACDSHLLSSTFLICSVSSNRSSSNININLGRRTLIAVRRFVIVLVPHKSKPYGHLVLCSQYLCPATLDCVPRPRDCPCPNVEDIKCLILDTATGTDDATVVCTRGQNGCVEVENLLKKRVRSKKK